MGKTSDIHVGLTLSMDSAVATVTAESGSGLGVLEVGRIGFSPGAIGQNGVSDTEVVVDALRELWSRAKIPTTRRVAVCINHPGITMQLTAVPVMPERDLGPVLHGIAESYGVFEGADIVSDWALIEEIHGTPANKLNTLLVAGKQQLVNSLLSAVQAAGLEVEVADTLPAAMMRLVYPAVTVPEPVAVVMVTEHVSYIWIFQLGKLKVSYTANIGHAGGRRQARSLSDQGNAVDGGATRLPADLIKELRNCFRFFHTEHHPQRISKVMLLAGGDRTSEAVALSGDLGLPVEARGTADFLACDGDNVAAAGTVDAMSAIGASAGLCGPSNYPLTISLAPKRRKKLISVLDIVLGCTSLTAVIAASIFLGGNISHQAALNRAEANKDKAAATEISTKISTLEEELKLRNFRSEAVKSKIEELQKTQVVRLSQVISEIAERKPQGLWLESVGMDSGKLLIKGTCASNDIYANFIDYLSASPLIEWVTPSSIQRKQGGDMFEFEVTGRVIGSSVPVAAAQSGNKKELPR